MLSWLNLKIRNLCHPLSFAQLCSPFHNLTLSVKWISVSSLQLLELFSNVRKYRGGIRLNAKSDLGDWKASWTATAISTGLPHTSKKTGVHMTPFFMFQGKKGRNVTLPRVNTDGNLISQGTGGQLKVLT